MSKKVENKVEETVQPEVVKLSVDIVNKVLSYLGTKPYQESAGLIVAIQEDAKKNN